MFKLLYINCYFSIIILGPTISEENKELNKAYYSTKEGKMHFFNNSWGDVSNDIDIVDKDTSNKSIKEIHKTNNNYDNNDFKNNLILYYNEMQRLTLILLKILEIGLDLPVNYFIGINISIQYI